MIVPIFAYGDPTLRKRCTDIDAQFPNLETTITNMWDTMNHATGIGLAAPQIVFPWGSRDQFPYAFVHTNIPDDDLERARKNLNPDYLRALALAQGADANINARMVMNNYSQTLYYYGQAHPISLLNAFAWSQFIKDLKEGKYKNPNKK